MFTLARLRNNACLDTAEHPQSTIWQTMKSRRWKKFRIPSSPVSQTLIDTCIQRLKSALWFSIGKIVDEETLKLGVNATPQFIGALTEMVWAQIGEFAAVPRLSGVEHILTDMVSR